MSSYTTHEVFADKASDYLDKHNVYDLFGSILKDLVVNQPKDPIAHMISMLERPKERLRCIVLGPPGSGVDDQVNAILAEFGMVKINVEKLLQMEVDNKSSFGAKVKDCRDNMIPISDELVTTILKSRVNKSDCLNKGWLLDGYPATAKQLRSLQLAGLLPNKVVLLNLATEKAKANASESGLYQDLSTEAFNAMFAEYERNFKQIAPLFPSQIVRFVDASAEPSDVWAEVNAFCAKPSPSKAPRRPMRVAVLGPTGSGKATQCTKMAHKYGLIHISTGELLRAEMAKSAERETQLKPFVDAGMLAPDDVVSEIVIRRLLQTDCRSRGWMLDGFPRTTAQAESLRKVNLSPNRVIFLEVNENESQRRCLSQRVDPENGQIYNILETKPPQAVAKRLETQTKNKANVMANLLKEYWSNVESVKKGYEGTMTQIDGDTSVDNVFEAIETFYLASLGSAKY